MKKKYFDSKAMWKNIALLLLASLAETIFSTLIRIDSMIDSRWVLIFAKTFIALFFFYAFKLFIKFVNMAIKGYSQNGENDGDENDEE